MVPAEEPRARLARLGKLRRLELRRTQADVGNLGGLDRTTVAAIERASPVREMSLAAYDHGLDWEVGSAMAILRGGEPTEMVPDRLEAMRRVVLARHRRGEISDGARDELLDELDREIAQRADRGSSATNRA